MHQFKPKMTGGVDQSIQGISPEAHKEWTKKGKPHPAGMTPAAAPMKTKATSINKEASQHSREKKVETKAETSVKSIKDISSSMPKSKTKGLPTA